MNIKNYLWEKAMAKTKTAFPILSFPAGQKMNATVNQLVNNSSLQAKAMSIINSSTPTIACPSFMDLSVEAEAFGSEVHFPEDDVPSVIGKIIKDYKDAENLSIPLIGTKRTGIYIEAIQKAKNLIKDKPVFAGITGPFTLAGRLCDVVDVMLLCYDNPETIHLILSKVTKFLIDYCKAFFNAGADGIILAEPLAGLLSAEMCLEFSIPYVKELVDNLQKDSFAIIYHNCGNSVINMLAQIYSIGATGYHFGNSVDLHEILNLTPSNILCLGNIDPAGEFTNGTRQSIKTSTISLLKKVGHYKNFIISSGCDIPPQANWNNINTFFQTIDEYNENFNIDELISK